ncbi:hypothetical protein RUM43_014380 [Polyplax serrata]|uniref:Uncharacterized protein n=1 Tax=Polyplax serrata TaxID=468196 RepID=A0AAN8RS25_POLSC
MRQKKKCEGTKVDEEKQEACVKCSKLQNGRQNSFEEADTQAKQTTLSTLKSVLKRGASHKKDKLAKSSEKPVPKDMQIVGKKTKNRVQFDESQNKYFEADYVILIHEEDYDLDDYYDEGSPYDDEDDDIYDDGMAPPKICCSNPNCNNTITLSNYSQHGYHPANGLMDLNYPRGHDRDRYDFTHFYDANYDEEINQNTRKSSAITTNRCENEKCQNCNSYFDFEMRLKPDTSQDFSDQVDQVTLSPPEGYKDGGSQCCPHHGLHFHNTVNDVAQHRMTGRDIQFHEGK